MHQMSDEEFERAIEEALDGLPPQFLEALENVAVVWEIGRASCRERV